MRKIAIANRKGGVGDNINLDCIDLKLRYENGKKKNTLHRLCICEIV